MLKVALVLVGLLVAANLHARFRDFQRARDHRRRVLPDLDHRLAAMRARAGQDFDEDRARRFMLRPPWRLPPKRRPLKRFAARMHAWQWGEFVNTRPGSAAAGEPEHVDYRDFRSFLRLWPNPGFTMRGRHWCVNPRCPTPWRVEP